MRPITCRVLERTCRGGEERREGGGGEGGEGRGGEGRGGEGRGGGRNGREVTKISSHSTLLVVGGIHYALSGFLPKPTN